MKRLFLATVCLVLFCQRAPAPIYGSFPGLDKLIDGADFIVVAEITKAPFLEDLDMGAGGTYKIKLIRVLKGNAKENKEASAYLRDLPFQFGPTKGAALTQGFVPGQLCLLFLCKPGTHTRDANDKPLPVDFEDENCEGDAVWISSPFPTGHFDLESLTGKSVRESVVALLNHSAIQEQKFAMGIRTMIESPPVADLERTTPVFVVKNAEEAAKFYVSVFTDPQRPYPTGQSRIIHIFRSAGNTREQNKVLGVIFLLDDQKFIAVNQTSNDPSPSAGAFTLECTFGGESDYFRKKLSTGTQQSADGWIKDKFGVSWNFGPNGIDEALAHAEESERSSSH